MEVHLHHQSQRLLRLVLDFVFVPLAKCEQSLVPENGQLAIVVDERGEMAHERCDHRNREGVFLVQQGSDEYRRGAVVFFHLRQFVDGNGRVMDRNRDSLQHRRDDGGLSKRAFLLAERKQDPLEKRRWLVNGLLQRDIVVVVQLLLLINIGSNGIQQDQIVEPLRQFRAKIRREDSCRCVHCMRRPEIRSRQVENLFPIAQRWDHLERFGELPGSVTTQNFTYFGVNFYDFLGKGRELILVIFLHFSVLLTFFFANFFHDYVRKCLAFFDTST
mmetsp:Transcript_18230/g.41989  ORF Transcript_18230/g.41989 Transcript_18230/m.41989 type:complete len:274 (-) Transcript_18230:577-1398(-)